MTRFALALLATACTADAGTDLGAGDAPDRDVRVLAADVYADKVRGSWQATMVANHSGLDLQGIWVTEPGPGDEIEVEASVDLDPIVEPRRHVRDVDSGDVVGGHGGSAYGTGPGGARSGHSGIATKSIRRSTAVISGVWRSL